MKDFADLCFTGAVLECLKAPLVLTKIRLDRELDPGHVLVKMRYSGLCRTQLAEARGWRGKDKWLPHLLGHEGVGEVLACGNKVTKVLPGQTVILTWLKAFGLDPGGFTFESEKGLVNAGPVTTLSQYVVVSENRIVRKPPQIPDELACLFGCALPTGVGMVLNEANISQDCAVALVGLGGVGMAALAAVIEKNPARIVVVDNNPLKLQYARELGITEVYSFAQGLTMVRLADKMDVVIESAGKIETIEFAYSLVKPGGGCLRFASHPDDSDVIRIRPHDLIRGKNIMGSWGGSTVIDEHLEMYWSLFQNSQDRLKNMLSKPYSLFEINDALYDLESEKVFRPLIDLGYSV